MMLVPSSNVGGVRGKKDATPTPAGDTNVAVVVGDDAARAATAVGLCCCTAPTVPFCRNGEHNHNKDQGAVSVARGWFGLCLAV